MNHAKAAEVPIIVAINKIDRPDANPDRVLEQLSQHGLVPEKWGGDTICVEISALAVARDRRPARADPVVAEVDGARRAPEGRATGTVLEANLEVGRGPVATVMVQEGLLRGRRPRGRRCGVGARSRPSSTTTARPGEEASGRRCPVQLLGFSEAAPGRRRGARGARPRPRAHARRRARPARAPDRAPADRRGGRRALGGLFEQLQRGETATLNLVLKADVQGSLEAVTESLRKLERDDVKLAFVAPRRRRDHRERRPARQGLERHDHRLQRAPGPPLARAGRAPGRRDPDLRDHLQARSRTSRPRCSACSPRRSRRSSPARPRCARSSASRASGAIAGCYVRDGHDHAGLQGPLPARRRRSSGRARSRRCAASRTTCARSPRASSAASALRTSRT